MWPLLWKGIVVFTALAFISSVSKHRPPKSLDSALLLLLLGFFFEKRFYILCAQKNGAAFWVDEHSFLSCFVCVYSIHLSNTGILTCQDLRCLPLPSKLSQASFVSPGLALFSHRYTGQHSHSLTLAGSFVLSPSNGTWASLSIPSSLVFWSLQKTRSVRGKLLPGVSCMSWWAWGDKKMRPNSHQCIFQSLVNVPWVVTVSPCLVNVWAEDTQILSLSGWI